MKQKSTSLKAVDFFCGAGGMSFGLHRAGVRIIGGIDNSPDCRETYITNLPNAKYLLEDISKIDPIDLAKSFNIKVDDPDLIFCGCSPCQFWSKIRTNKVKSARTAFLLLQFQKFIEFFRPGFVIVENVPGLYRRKNESILFAFVDFLQKIGYNCSDGIINAKHYGVPQNRMRYLLLASRSVEGISLPLPEKLTSQNVRDYLGVNNGFNKIVAGHRDQTEFEHTAAALSIKNQRRITLTPKSGGDRSAWSTDEELQINAYKGRDGIFKDVYGRMSWDRPAPTITTRFNSLSNGRFGHPDEDRAISIREGATLQTFPKSFMFRYSNITALARQIGNAVPPELAFRIGTHLISVRSNG